MMALFNKFKTTAESSGELNTISKASDCRHRFTKVALKFIKEKALMWPYFLSFTFIQIYVYALLVISLDLTFGLGDRLL